MGEDSGGWAPPSGGGADEPPRWGQRVEGWTPPAEPQPAPPPQPGGEGWTPPPKRGLFPLHPLGFGQLLGAAFGVIRWNPRATVLPALIISVIQQGIAYGAILLFSTQVIDRVTRAATAADRQQIIAGAIGGGIALTLLTIAVSLFGTALLQGLLVDVVARAATGGRPTAGHALRVALPRVRPLIGLALVIAAAELLVIGVFVLLIVLVAQAGTVGVVFAVLLGVVGFAALIALVLVLAVKLSTAPSVIVIEGRGTRAAIARSWRLTRGFFWRTAGLLVVVYGIVVVGAQVVSIPFSLIGSAVIGLLLPNAGSDLASDPAAAIPALLLTSLPGTIAATVVAGIGQIAQVAAVVLVYLDIRMRREGLDLELQRSVEQGAPDPLEPAR